MIINKIFLTKGDNTYSHCNQTGKVTKSDKAIAIESAGKLYWLDISTCCLKCAEYHLKKIDPDFYVVVIYRGRGRGKSYKPVHVHRTPTGYSYEIEHDAIPLSKPTAHHDDLFNSGSKLLDKAERLATGSIWHSPVSLAGVSRVE